VAQEFEAFVIQSFIQEMLPKDASGVFGRGIAGDIWRSMLSEKLAFEVAERGSLGIADQVRSAQAIAQAPGAAQPSNVASGALDRELMLGATGAGVAAPGFAPRLNELIDADRS
jgi:Rod binding domain-containing protein